MLKRLHKIKGRRFMKRLLQFLMLLATVFLVSACTDDSETAVEGESLSEGGDLIMSFPTDIISMDSHGSEDPPSEQVRHTIYEGLVTHNENMEIVPALRSEERRVGKECRSRRWTECYREK